MRTNIAYFLCCGACAGWLVLCVTGFQPSHSTASEDAKMKRLKKLYWCIDQIEERKILRGMRTNELQEVFGGALKYNYHGQLACYLSPSPGEINPAHANYQAGPMWKIEFTINTNGFVTDYSLKKTGEL